MAKRVPATIVVGAVVKGLKSIKIIGMYSQGNVNAQEEGAVS